MALFSRRSKSDNAASEADAAENATTEASVSGAPAPVTAEEPSTPDVPNVSISMETFRGVGAASTPAPTPQAPPVRPATPALPLAPADPPEQTETVPGMKDNVLLREALAELGEAPTNEQLLGVLRQTLQGHLYLRVQGDAQEQINAGQPLAIAVAREGENQFMLAYSSAGAVKASVLLESDPTATSAVAQPVHAVFSQLLAGPFAGVVLDTASAPHRAVFPRELIEKAMNQADPGFALKTQLATPRDASSEARVGEELATARLWVAVATGQEEGQFGIAEAQTADGSRLLQLFSHPLEIIALGRGEQPMPFTAEQLGTVLAQHAELDGVLIDAAGPTIAVRRAALGAVIALAKPQEDGAAEPAAE
ncbi:hypothetical protein JOD62_002122 [Microbacterium keratanolyticum]|uniref:SseB protein N-terminal domain-containing protein n=1 Tax=Microbacterium keratanolyticum TaxID=67574 RepID=A0A9W6HSE1_9MICO|nr:SseB family protein [Microbacterium keratanolyticum]MBM7469574.1 hypothetical protein [Microbacterium keratanolyticum]GLK01653.1 hypothetical protein GCM10017596_13680 [Microbacterium keratanolyticum]